MTNTQNTALTPMMQQFRNIKAQYPDALLLFRCGDFYETYAEDAEKASKILSITLTHRSNGAGGSGDTLMAGFPFHALDTYLPKLVRAGLRVAICDQLEDPKLTKKLVKRGVTELVTPGVSYSDTTLPDKENNYVACVQLSKKGNDVSDKFFGVAFLDISTGEFMAAQGDADYVDKLLTNFAPKEVLFERGKRQAFEALFGNGYFTFELEDWMMTEQAAFDRLTKQFSTTNLKGFGFEIMPQAIIAAGAILHYLDITQHTLTAHIQHLSRIETDRYMWLDRFTVRNLELFGENGNTLYSVLNRTITPMGARMLHNWMAFPLKEVEPIRKRQQAVEYFFRHPDVEEQVANEMKAIGDLERISTKISTGRATPRDVLQICYALRAVANIKKLLTDNPMPDMQIANGLAPLTTLATRISKTITSNPPSQISKADYIRDGINEELDELRHLQNSGKQYLIGLQQREAEQTGIQSLKIGYNNVFGYYLEVRNTYKDLVPSTWIRKQTLAQAERYITEELKVYEEKILGATERIAVLELQVFNELLVAMSYELQTLLVNARHIATLDSLRSLTEAARQNHYVCPEINDSLIIDIHAGRHPVIEQQMPVGEQYVPNDVMLDNNTEQIIIITGPNMSGKSALLRQTALIVLMAQMGSFVPADSAKIGVVDKIFTRVGASDNISMGESTFMVEMNEASAILNNLSQRSLVLFDELGRGTSTYDGISIAWAIVEYIHENQCHAKTLFATHYHELNEMEKQFKRIRNYNVAVKEIKDRVVFLRKLVRGGSEHSFGIHVAQMAGMPKSIVKRAEQVLKHLEQENQGNTGQLNKSTKALSNIADSRQGVQLSFFQLDDPVLEQVRDEIKNMDINNLTPIEALNKLSEIRKIVTGK